jgi:predicted RNase H-like HicB family nuclease
MDRYAVLIDGEAGAYGVVFPDVPGCVAIGATVAEALQNAQEALRDFAETSKADGLALPPPRPLEAVRSDPDVAEALADGSALATLPLVLSLSRPVKANLSLDSGILAAIDAKAGQLKISRSALVELLAKDGLSAL